jgi:hypothetical protein
MELGVRSIRRVVQPEPVLELAAPPRELALVKKAALSINRAVQPGRALVLVVLLLGRAQAKTAEQSTNLVAQHEPKRAPVV